MSRPATTIKAAGPAPPLRAVGGTALAFVVLLPAPEERMVLFLVILLVVLWAIGMVTTTMLGGWLHALLVIAVIFLLIRLIRGQPV
jgi:hypothetical protein